MTVLCNTDGKLVTNPKEILVEQKKFYQQLYTKDSNIEFKLINEQQTEMDLEKKEQLDKMISFEEVTAAVKALKRSVTPGIDGLNVKFYQFFWSKFGHLYYNTLILSFEN